MDIMKMTSTTQTQHFSYLTPQILYRCSIFWGCHLLFVPLCPLCRGDEALGLLSDETVTAGSEAETQINKFWVLWDNWCGHNSDGSNIHLFECEMGPDNNLEWASREIKIFTPHASFGKKEFMSKSRCIQLKIVNLIIISLPAVSA